MSQAASAYQGDLDRPIAGAGSSSRKRRLRWGLMAAGVLAVLVGGPAYWLSSGRWVSTDDAYVQADSLTLSTDVSGIVAGIPVREGQSVRQGDVLFSLDPQKFRIAIDNAVANLAQAKLAVESMKADYQAALRQIGAREQQVSADQLTYDRLAYLVKSHAATQQATDDARYKLAADQEAVSAAQAQARAILAKLAGNPDIAPDDAPSVKQAQAEVAEAVRAMNHAVVRAPYDGIVTQVSKLQPGMFLPAGTAAFGFVSTDRVWVQAQPKETQLTYARTGDPVEVSFDIYPGRTWTGVVEDIAPATDQNFSLLPAQNSSGNWVKVVQRIPVRIRVDRKPGDPPLRAGMSAQIDIDTGHVRTLHDLL
ncbi:MAG: HlyD family secretion protein [Proteobacteria bacterium]|nr:HlyD family secretion protein [Pseudomonadota bacterium]